MKRYNPQASSLRPQASRRGVLLLVVLSLLVLFALIGVTFVLVAGQHYRSLKMEMRGEQYGDDPRKLCDAVAAQCIRDTNNINSVLRGQSLLNDMYGNDGLKIAGTITISITQDTAPAPVNQLMDISFPDAGTAMNFASYFGGVVTQVPTNPDPLRPLSRQQMQSPGFFNGCVLTFLDGLAANRSTRIVGWGYNGTEYTIRAMAFEDIDTNDLAAPNNPTALLINGRPFNGTGFGYNPTAPVTDPTLLSAQQTAGAISIPFALLPNPVFAANPSREYELGKVPASGNPIPWSIDFSPPSYNEFGGIGGADEDYDAPDTQNMLLAHLPLNPPTSTPWAILPSLHRPDTWSFVMGNLVPAGADPRLKAYFERELLLRPTAADHPSFPRVKDLALGPFDVDNDGDGIRESIWVDVGFPVQTMPDGRAMKPMAAILCIDLGGRLNVNAHGSIAHVDQHFHSPTVGTPSPAQTLYEANVIPQGAFPGGATTMQAVARGQGYGPAEISLYPLFTPLGSLPPATVPTPSPYANLLAARYAEPNTNLTILSGAAYDSAPGVPVTRPYPGITGWNDPLSDLRFNQYNYPSSGRSLSAFGSPANLQGRGMTFLDVRGTPLTPYVGGPPLMPYVGGPIEVRDDPYELDLSRRAVRASATPALSPQALTVPDSTTPNPHDSPFTVAELERVLRMYDIDASELPDRLRVLVDRLINGSSGPPLDTVRNMITTDSFDLPSPSVLPTRQLRQDALDVVRPSIGLGISDLLRIRLLKAGMADTAIPAQIQKMLPWDLIAGQRMDINRPFGNGRDDSPPGTSGYGVVDEPGEIPDGNYWNATRAPSPQFDAFDNALGKPNNGVDVNGDGSGGGATPDKKLARHLYARHLYVLLRLLNDQDIDFDGNGTTSPEETVHGLAQWAINVVDFCDRDSIMTPFEFDVNPFNGWDVDGIVDGWQGLTSGDDNHLERRLVWGCERPELLITETLAFHDRRTEDLTIDDKVIMPADPLNPDEDFDQRLVPRGSVFIELYNPWNTETSTRQVNGFPSAGESPGEFYAINTPANFATGVQLHATTGGFPVWRMLVVKGNALFNQQPKDPDDPVPANRPKSNSPFSGPPGALDDVERSIYFAEPPNTITNHGQPYFSSATPAPLLPGRYGVVGSVGLRDGANYVTTIGRLKNFGSETSQDGINARTQDTRRIILSPNANPNTNQVAVFNGGAEPTPPDVQPAIAVVVDKSFVGNNPVDRSLSITEPFGGYTTAGLDTSGPEPVYSPTPLDIPLDAGSPDGLDKNGTVPRFRVVHLQRLADPTAVYDPMANPYLTIDTATIRLVRFNGATSDDEPNVGGKTDGIPAWQRGDKSTLFANALWSRDDFLTPPTPSGVTPLPGMQDHNFNFTLVHSLGHLSTAYGSKYLQADAPLPAYRGAPKKAFPWLTWNNRPFVGPMELLLVPKTRSSRLLFDYNPQPNVNLYQPPPVIPPAAPIHPRTPNTGHLLNFFQIPPALPDPPRNPTPAIFEYLHVPSRFAGTETMLDPASLANPLDREQELFSLLHPPFNKVSNYREPGRVNINTIPSDTDAPNTSAIWNAIVNATPGAASPPNWTSVVFSRQGFSGSFSSSSSSIFGNPFRSAAGHALRLPYAPNLATRQEVDVTLMRSIDPTGTATNATPLLDDAATAAYVDTAANPAFRMQNLQRVSNLVTTRSNVYAIWITVGFFEANPAPHPSIVGPTATKGLPSVIYPDGYQLGQEVGADTGEVKRHRAFYIFDRSIPVGFEPGQDHNYEDGLLLKRFIE